MMRVSLVAAFFLLVVGSGSAFADQLVCEYAPEGGGNHTGSAIEQTNYPIGQWMKEARPRAADGTIVPFWLFALQWPNPDQDCPSMSPN